MSEVCLNLHQWANSLPVHRFPYDEKIIPTNGIYILFQKGETAHGTNRVVRVGTHTGDNQLRSRLWQHFLNENKDRSIFRKNIGRCLLNKEKDAYLEKWEWDLTTRAAKEKYSSQIDLDKQRVLEKKITDYLQQNFSFVTLNVPEKDVRLQLESKMLSTLAECEECNPSSTWLGNFSPQPKIKENGLWNVQGIDKSPLSLEELVKLKSR